MNEGLSIRDPIHGFIRADALETALVDSLPLQRLRTIHQLGLASLIFPGAVHSRFSHVLGTMHLAGRLYDALAGKSNGALEDHPRAPTRRLVRVAALLHDIGHAPFSHTAEELFDEPIDHEEMTRRLLATDEIAEIFARHGDGLEPAAVAALLAGEGEPLLGQIVSGELDVDKMDYLLRDSLFCGVRYGSYDLERLLDTVEPLAAPDSGEVGIGVAEGGVHALEALVLARYYMFTQVYFNVVGKALELHFNRWLQEDRILWPSRPTEFLEHDDVTVTLLMRRSTSRHARAVSTRSRYPLAFETREHLKREEKIAFEQLLTELLAHFGSDEVLVSNSSKDPHRLGSKRVLVRFGDGRLEPMEQASHFIRHLGRIERYRVYAAPHRRDDVTAWLRARWG